MLLSREKSQLLVVDIQANLLAAITSKERVVERCERLLRAASALNIPVTVSEQYPRGLGPTVDPLRDLLGKGSAVIEKVEFSCAKNAALRERMHDLRRQGRSQVVIAGIEAHVCVTQTAIDLEEQGFEAFVVADAIGSRAPESRELAISRLLRSGADVVDSDMVIFEWLGRAGTPEFKDLLALLK